MDKTQREQEELAAEALAASLKIANTVLFARAAMYDDMAAYDPTIDQDGFIVSVLLALRHHCRQHDMDWSGDLETAIEMFEDDLCTSK